MYDSVALMYLNGTGVRQNIDEAINWLKKDEEIGDTDCISDLGFCYYYRGIGVEQDYLKALKLWKKRWR